MNLFFKEKAMIRIWKLQLNQYLKDFYIIFSGWFITLFTLLVWLILRETEIEGIKYDTFILASAIGASTIRNCLYNFSKFISKIKECGVYNRIVYTGYPKSLFLFNLIVFNQIINIFISIFLILVAMVFSQQRLLIMDVNWLMVFYGYITLAVSCNLIGLLLIFNLKSTENILFLTNLYYYLSMYLLGLIIPFSVITDFKILFILCYFFPQKYSMSILQSGWINSSDFSLINLDGNIIEQGFGYGNYNFIPYLVSMLLILVLIGLLYFTFNSLWKENKHEKKFKK